MLILRVILALVFSSIWSAAWAQQQVGLELVLAVDSSTSVDAGEFALQQKGLADAFRHPSVVRAIEAHAPDGIAVTLVQWAGRSRQRTSVEWARLPDAASAARFAAQIARAPRLINGFTDIAAAIRFSARKIFENGFTGLRQVIDVSGDGSSNGEAASAARDQAIARGITVNGLVIHNEEYDLGELAKINLVDHYRQHVVGGPGSFLMIAKDFEDFRTAIRKKLLREITGPVVSLAEPKGLTAALQRKGGAAE